MVDALGIVITGPATAWNFIVVSGPITLLNKREKKEA